jgi:hypothetical protein
MPLEDLSLSHLNSGRLSALREPAICHQEKNTHGINGFFVELSITKILF